MGTDGSPRSDRRRHLVHPYLQHPEWHADRLDRPIAFAHRGGTDAAPENTVAAFEHAVSLGYRYLETDVHLTRDGELVAFHDDDLDRTAGITARIGELTAAEIAEIRLPGDHAIPTLQELFERFPEAHFNIDAKAEESVEPLCDFVRTRGAADRVCLASFSQRRVDRMRTALGDAVMTNLGVSSITRLRITGTLPDRGPQSAQVPTNRGLVPIVDRRFVERAGRLGLPVHVWTINDPVEIARLLDLGVDGIMTDETEMLRDVFSARGLWN